MKWIDRRAHSAWRLGAAAASLVTLVLLLAATLWLWTNAERDSNRVARQSFDYQVNRNRFSIEQRLLAYRETLLGAAGLFDANGDMTRQAWHAYVQALRIEHNYPGIQALGFAVQIPPDGLAAHIRAIRAQGFPDYTVYPPGVRPDMTAVVFVEPFDWRNRRAFGYDMLTEPVRREAMQRARDTGQATASGKVTLVQETKTGVQNGFLMYEPVYRGDASPLTKAARRAQLFGYIYAAFRMNDLMSGILGQDDVSKTHVEIFDGGDLSATHLLYDSVMATDPGASVPASARPAFMKVVPIEFGGRVWTLKFTSLPKFDAAIDVQKPRLILAAGSLISVLMALVIWSLLVSKEQSIGLINANHKLTDEIDERIRLETELKQAKEAAEAANEAKSEFLANVSHELRTPLTLILAPASQLLATTEPPGNWRVQIERLQRNALILLNRVNELLDFSKAQAGKFKAHIEAVNLTELVDMLAGDAAVVAASMDLTLEWSVDAEVGTVFMDREHLERILLNLIGNALKFTPAGGTIRVDARAVDNEKFELRVQDTGIGIAAEDFAILFERFAQVDTSATRRNGGTGIGLALVKALTTLMKGEIAVHSRVGEGTEFVLEFPRLSPQAAEQQASDAPAEITTPLQQALRQAYFTEGLAGRTREDVEIPSPDGTPGKLVLVADDSAQMRAYIRELLSDAWSVVCVEDGEKAWHALLTRPFDIVVSDVMMPRLDGLQLAERMKSNSALRHIPIILLTARGDSLSSSSGLDRGADDYLAKPFVPEELRARLRAAARMSDVQATLREKSREAGMSMLATGVLHNLGNVLNSVTTGATLIKEQLDRSSVAGLSKVVALLEQQGMDLSGFFTHDPRAPLLPRYIAELSGQLNEERDMLLKEASVVIDCCEHAREVINSHRQFAQPTDDVSEVLLAGDLMDAAYKIASAAFNVDGVRVERRYEPAVSLVTDRHKVLQILINLIANALQAMADMQDKSQLALAVKSTQGRVQMMVEDNGAGIDPTHLAVLFNQRFTTRAEGNGIGLHSSATWARELGGQMRVTSKGIGHGSIFVLDLPTNPLIEKNQNQAPDYIVI
ncbi:CHASE domain-containing protein [Bordetella sp. FB-8]|uniref:CHASE domain-containing protein n=1 Tax=Bordetella sp. FB-8 TaxID=1159870 RepID=UPI0003600998|nr:CHASE domain-containing protein [Bordetella sp. FB-8]